VCHDIGPEVIAYLIRFPLSSIESPLYTIGTLLPEELGHLPAILALTGREQRTQIAEDSTTRLNPAEPWCDAAVQHLKLLLPLLNHPPHGQTLLCSWGTTYHQTAAVVLEFLTPFV
jgi:hypothetical protein